MFLERLKTLAGLRPAARAAGELRAVIDEVASAWPFSEAAIDLAPAAAGVFMLYRDGRLIYIGLAPAGSGIRAELASHRAGAHGHASAAATAFLYEQSAEPRPLYERYLEAHRARYGGRLPPANDAELRPR
jgi:hypothetical protein